jgi:hypothetical protein
MESGVAPRRILHTGHDREDSGRDKPEAQRATAARLIRAIKNENRERREVNRDRGPGSRKQILCGWDAQIEAKAQTAAEDSRAGIKTASATTTESKNQKIFSTNRRLYESTRSDSLRESMGIRLGKPKRTRGQEKRTTSGSLTRAPRNVTGKQRPDPVKSKRKKRAAQTNAKIDFFQNSHKITTSNQRGHRPLFLI